MNLSRWLPFLLLGVAAARAAAADPFGKPLTAAQVACEDRQLSRLMYRMVVHYSESNLFVWRSTSGGGLYAGLAASSQMLDPVTQLPSHKEEELAFDLLLRKAGESSDPQNPRRPQATLVRRDAASNLSSEPERPDILDMVMDLASEVPDPTHPKVPLQITNRRALGAGQADRAGRGLVAGELFTACHAQVSDFDLKIFSLLAHTVRASSCLLASENLCIGGFTRFKASIFRGAEPLTYRMNIHRYDTGCRDENEEFCYGEGGIALLFRLQADSEGRLTGGDVDVLPWCKTGGLIGCTDAGDPEFGVFVLPPLKPGEIQGAAAFRRAAHLNVEFLHSPNNILHATVNWPDLLRDTAWNDGNDR
ncbi:MAG TPA: hypothetical protein VH988_29350 [Thermoanaerobaculia bacterium]|jgi:hypothetical protein|nr:hypothetical protein [Thermoanaerobaculia bacterium]